MCCSACWQTTLPHGSNADSKLCLLIFLFLLLASPYPILAADETERTSVISVILHFTFQISLTIKSSI